MLNFRLYSVAAISLALLSVTGCNKSNKQKGSAPVATAPAAAEKTESKETTEKKEGAEKEKDASSDAKSETTDKTEKSETKEEKKSEEQAADPSALFQDCETAKGSNFVADLYRIQPETQKLPNFDDLKAVRKICLNQLSISSRGFEGGFPGVPDIKEYFALDIKFKLKIAKAGEYYFRLISDDGANLYLNGTKLIDNDGRHATREKDAKISMTAGTHDVNLQYFQGPRPTIALELKWKAPGDGKEVYIPLDLVSRP